MKPTFLLNLCLPDLQHKVITQHRLADGELHTVHQLVLQYHNGVRIPDCCLQQSLGVLRVPGGHNLQTGDGPVPCCVALGVLGGDTGGGAVGTTENDGAFDGAAGHVFGFSGRVDDLVDCL